jgi:hypothetical protein
MDSDSRPRTSTRACHVVGLSGGFVMGGDMINRSRRKSRGPLKKVDRTNELLIQEIKRIPWMVLCTLLYSIWSSGESNILW